MVETSKPDVVLGVGNPLMGDDGLGIAVVAALRERWMESDTLRLVDGGTWGMNLLPLIEDARRLLIIDAIDRGGPPGSRVLLTREQVPRYFGRKLSPHQIDLREVLALADLRGTLPVKTLAIGLQPEYVGLSTSLSGSVAAALPRLTADIERHLYAWGHEPAAEPALCTK